MLGTENPCFFSSSVDRPVEKESFRYQIFLMPMCTAGLRVVVASALKEVMTLFGPMVRTHEKQDVKVSRCGRPYLNDQGSRAGRVG